MVMVYEGSFISPTPTKFIQSKFFNAQTDVDANFITIGSDYFQSDPYRTPSMLREDIPRISNHMKGGSVDWSSFLLQARKALGKVNIDHVKTGINAVKTIDSSIDAVKNYRKGDKSKALLNLGSATLYGLSAKDSYNKTKKIQGEGKKSKSKSEKIARGLALLESMR